MAGTWSLDDTVSMFKQGWWGSGGGRRLRPENMAKPHVENTLKFILDDGLEYYFHVLILDAGNSPRTTAEVIRDLGYQRQDMLNVMEKTPLVQKLRARIAPAPSLLARSAAELLAEGEAEEAKKERKEWQRRSNGATELRKILGIETTPGDWTVAGFGSVEYISDDGLHFGWSLPRGLHLRIQNRAPENITKLSDVARLVNIHGDFAMWRK